MSKFNNEKTHYHSTVGLRGFMKMMGMGAGSFGLSAMGGFGAPFKDLDEMMASPQAE